MTQELVQYSASIGQTLQLKEGITARIIHGRKSRIPLCSTSDQICIESKGLEPKLVEIEHTKYGRATSLLEMGGDCEGLIKVDAGGEDFFGNAYGFMVFVNYREGKIEDVQTPAPSCLK